MGKGHGDMMQRETRWEEIWDSDIMIEMHIGRSVYRLLLNFLKSLIGIERLILKIINLELEFFMLLLL